MIVVLKGRAAGYVYDFLREHGSRQSLIRTDVDGLERPITELKREGSPCDNVVLGWIPGHALHASTIAFDCGFPSNGY